MNSFRTEVTHRQPDMITWALNALEITLENLLDIQTEVATQIAGALETELSVEEQVLVEARYTEDLGAYQAYLRGRYFQRLPHYSVEDVARASMKIGLVLALVASLLQLATGHSSAEGVARHQPAKLAAFEGHYPESAPGAMYLVGWVDEESEQVTGISCRACSAS